MPPNRQHYDDLPFTEKMKLVQAMMLFPALTVVVFLRRRLGYRILNPAWLFGVTFFMCIAAAVVQNPEVNPEDLMVFALFVLIFGGGQRAARWREFRQGVLQHSYYLGDSILESLPLPRFLRYERRVCRIVDPTLCVAIGLALQSISRVLGLWLIFSGLSLRVVEGAMRRKQIEKEFEDRKSVV